MDAPHPQQPTVPPSGTAPGPQEGRVLAPVGFTGPPAGRAQDGGRVWPHGSAQDPVWASLTPPPAAAWTPPAPRGRRWWPAALAGAGVVLLLGGGVGGYALGRATADPGGAGATTGTTGQFLPGDGTVQGGDGGGPGQGFGGPAGDGSGRLSGRQDQLGQLGQQDQGGTGTGSGTGSGTSGGTGSTTTT